MFTEFAHTFYTFCHVYKFKSRHFNKLKMKLRFSFIKPKNLAKHMHTGKTLSTNRFLKDAQQLQVTPGQENGAVKVNRMSRY